MCRLCELFIDLTSNSFSKVQHLAVVGGKDVKETASNLMRTILTHDLSTKYCWKGHSTTGKREFRSLKLQGVLFSKQPFLFIVL